MRRNPQGQGMGMAFPEIPTRESEHPPPKDPHPVSRISETPPRSRSEKHPPGASNFSGDPPPRCVPTPRHLFSGANETSYTLRYLRMP